MPWRNPSSAPLTRIDIVSLVPSASGVFAIFDGDSYLLVGEAWNLKARLLELMNVVQDAGNFQVKYELCSEEERLGRRAEIAQVLLRSVPPLEVRSRPLPGIGFSP